MLLLLLLHAYAECFIRKSGVDTVAACWFRTVLHLCCIVGTWCRCQHVSWCCWDRTEIVVVIEAGLVFPSSALIRGVGAIHRLSEVVRIATLRTANYDLVREGQCLATCPAVQRARYVPSSLGTLVTYCRMFRSFRSGILPSFGRFVYIHVVKPCKGFYARRIAMHSNYCQLCMSTAFSL